MNSTTTDHSDQMENATWVLAVDQIRLRRAMAALPASHAAQSSGSKLVMWPFVMRSPRALGHRHAQNLASRWTVCEPTDPIWQVAEQNLKMQWAHGL